MLLKGTLGVTEFVNPDVIAQGLSAFAPERKAMAAGRIMLGQLRDLVRRRETFAFETTLATRSFAPWLSGLRRKGYRVHLLFLWLASPDLAVGRVRKRVQMGGHDVPEHDVRRRYVAGLRNFFRMYQHHAATWRVYDNSAASTPRLIARGRGATVSKVFDGLTWAQITKGHTHEEEKG
jgi:predicted ABC-type ATPase